MQNRDHQGEGQQGGQQGANTSGNKNHLAGKADNQRPDSTFERENSHREKPGDPNYNSNVNRNSNVNSNSDVNRSQLTKKFSQKYGLNEQQSSDAADSFLGSVNWASRQKQNDEHFSDFVNPQTPSSKNALYGSWQKEYNSRLLKNGFEENQANKLSSDEPDSNFQDLSSNGTDENWYRNFGVDSRDVGRDEESRRPQRSESNPAGEDVSDRREGETQAQADFRAGQSSTTGINERDGRERNGNNGRDGRSLTSEENSDSSDAEGSTKRKPERQHQV